MDLERLIVTEQRLDEALRVAHEEAARLIAEAQAAARRGEVEAELQTAARRFATETAVERERREREVACAAALRVARYEAVSPQQVTAAARDVVERLIAGATP